MKILMLCEFYNETLEYQENLLVKYYTKNGHQVTVVTSTFDSVFDYYNDRHDNSISPKVYFDGDAKIIKLRYRYNILNRLRAYTCIDDILAEEAPDLVYVHDISPNLPEVIRYVRAHPHSRVIMDYHADYSNSGKNWVSLKILHGILRKWFLDRARPYLSKIFVVVPASARFLNEVYKVPNDEIELLPLGADLDTCAEVKKAQCGNSLRRKLGIRDEAIVIFTGGKLDPLKRTELLIEAVRRLAHLPLELVIIGDSDPTNKRYGDNLRSMAAASANIRFTGWLKPRDIYGYLDMADIAVFPASQSILWQQAIAMGLPLIVGDTGGQDVSYLNLYENIIILQNEEITSKKIEQTVSEVVLGPQRLRAMSVGAQRVAYECLNWDVLVQKTIQFCPSS